MKIGIGNDRHGIKLKNEIIAHLKERNIDIINYGTDIEDTSDYVDYAVKVCDGINNKEIDLGILICATGIGMSIAANKIDGILCGKVDSIKDAELTKEHNMANVISFSENIENPLEIVDTFINTKYSTEERHIRRINKIKKLE